MSLENGENKNKRTRERYVTCTEETLEEMEKYLDEKFDDNTKHIGNSKSEISKHPNINDTSGTNHITNKRRGIPTIKTSKKQLLMERNENRSKTYGFVQRVRPKPTTNEKSPPSKAKEIEITQAKECSEENANDEDKSPPAKARRYEAREIDNDYSENINVEEENKAKKDQDPEEEALVDDDNDNESEDIIEDKIEAERNEIEEVEILVDDNDVHNIEEYAPNKKCLDCDKSYCDYKNKEVKKKCRICKCNEHGCQQRVYNVTSKGDTWLCGDCLKLTNLVERKHLNLFENLRKTLM